MNAMNEHLYSGWSCKNCKNIYGRETWHNMVTYDKLRIWRCSRFLVIAATSIQDDRRVLERSSSEISILTLRKLAYIWTLVS